jgi:lipase chaperone LimK
MRLRLEYLAIAIALSSGLAIWQLQPDTKPVAARATVAPNQPPARLGPGVWTTSTTPSGEVQSVAIDTVAPGGLAATPDGKLVINKALRDVIDYFLFGGHPGERSTHVAKLLAHLKAALPPPAFEEAVQIVKNYLAYIEAHDQLLAREAKPAAAADGVVAPMDMDKVAAWVAQRNRLRQNFLGLKVAEIWFGAEQAEAEQDLAAMRKRGQGSTDSISIDTDPLQQASKTLDALRAKGASLQIQRQYVATQFGEEAARRFDTVEREEQAWQARYAGYRRAADQINRQNGIDPIERAKQIEVLRRQTFQTEPERLRAQAFDQR